MVKFVDLDVQIHTFLTATLVGDEWSVSRASHLRLGGLQNGLRCVETMWDPQHLTTL
jgi:hypothetical protein